MKLKNNILISTLRLSAFALILLCYLSPASAADTNPANIPTLAIINKSKDKVLADLLFIELAKDEKINLVEREKIEIIQKEHEYNADSKDSNIKLGKLLKADALLFVSPLRDLSHFRLVETVRGQKILDTVFPSNLKSSEIVSQLKNHFSRWKGKLALPPKQRIYISVVPIIYGDKIKTSPIAKGNLATFNALLSTFISNADNIFALEREDLSSVAMEKKISHTEDIKDLDSSDFIVRGKNISLFPEGLKLELQLLPVRKKGKTSLIPLTINQNNVPKIAADASKKILSLVSALPQSQKADLAKESKLFSQKGEMCIARMDYRNAIQFFEIAAILDPNNIKAKARYAFTAIRYFKAKIEYNPPFKITRYNTKEKKQISNAEYMYMISILRKSIDFATGRKAFLEKNKKRTMANIRLSSYYDYLHTYLTKCNYAFLRTSYQQFKDEEKQEIKNCRQELKNFFMNHFLPFIPSQKETEKARIKLLLRFSPVIFETPEECFATTQPLLYKVKVPQAYFQKRHFKGNHFWDHRRTQQLWEKMLKELTTAKSKDLQFNSLLNLCEAEKSAHFKQLLNWLQIDKNYSWLNDDSQKNSYSMTSITRTVLQKIHNFPIQTQDQIFTELALKPFRIKRKIWKPKIERYIYAYCGYLKKRTVINVLSKKKPKDITAINALAKRAESIITQYDPQNAEIYTKLFKKSLSFKQNTDPKIVPEAIRNNSLSSKSLIHTSSIHTPESYFKGLEMFYDQGVVWIVFSTSKGFQITRIDLENGKKNIVDIPIPKMDGNFSIRITRFKDYLCLAGKKNVVMVPIIDKSPYFDISQKVAFGPELGDTQLGQIKQLHDRKVTCLIPGENYLYISLLETVNKRTRSGAVYRWKQGLKECEKVCASDSLGGTALDDSPPYKVVAATKLADSSDMIFALYGNLWVLGFWRYSPKTKQFKRILEEYIKEHKNHRLTPPFIFKDNFYIPNKDKCLYYNIKTLKLDQIFLSAFIQPGQEIFNPIPILGQKKGFWAVIKEKKGQLSVNRIDKNGNIHPILDDSYIYKYITTPKGLVVGSLNGKKFNFYFIPNDFKNANKQKNELNRLRRGLRKE